MARNLKTGWVAIATSGPVVHGDEDGRFIKKEWLQDMVETYNTRVFTAKLWPEHRRYFSAGTVLALKIEPATEPELAGEITLFAILSPSDWLVNANAAGDFTFPSIEVGENYRKTGKYFLRGLGLTDDPASAGVTELKFSSEHGDENAVVFSGRQIDLSDNIEESPSLVKRIFGISGREPHPNQEDDTMTPEQLQALTEQLSGHIDTKFSALREELTAAPAAGESAGESGDGDTPDPAAFTALAEENTALKGRIEALENKFKTFEDTPAGTGTGTPEGDGDGDQSAVV